MTKQPLSLKSLSEADVEALAERIFSDERLMQPLRQWELWGARRRAAAKEQGLFWDDDNILFDEPEPTPYWTEIYKSVIRERYGEQASQHDYGALSVRVSLQIHKELQIKD